MWRLAELWKRDDTPVLVEVASAMAGLGVAGVAVPRIVVVGTQSSGKSSLLNRMLRMPLLPVGSAMVTRTPIDIEMRCCADEDAESIRVGVGLDLREVSRAQVSRAVEAATREAAGEGMGISDTPVVVRARLRGIPDLNLTDLPGLTLTALTDRGQPADIKEQLVELARSYCVLDHTTVLGVFPARVDLEADYAFSVLRDIARPESVVGVLTKPDLCEDRTGIRAILDGVHSSDLRLHHGYYAVRADVSELPEELRGCKRAGVQALVDFCCQQQAMLLRKHLPQLRDRVEGVLAETETELRTLDSEVPDDAAGRATMAAGLCGDFARTLRERVAVRGSSDPVGRDLKQAFVAYREEVRRDVRPFSELDEETFQDVVRRMEGNHMASAVPGAEVVETLVHDLHPLRAFAPAGERLVGTVQALLSAATERALADALGPRFPRLLRSLEAATERLRAHLASDACAALQEAIAVQEAYVWTDAELEGGIAMPAQYAAAVGEVLADVVPKTVMHRLVRPYVVGRQLDVDPDDLLEEDAGAAKRRRELLATRRRCKAALDGLGKL